MLICGEEKRSSAGSEYPCETYSIVEPRSDTVTGNLEHTSAIEQTQESFAIVKHRSGSVWVKVYYRTSETDPENLSDTYITVEYIFGPTTE